MNSMYIGAMDKARLSDLLSEARRCFFIRFSATVVLTFADAMLLSYCIAKVTPL